MWGPFSCSQCALFYVYAMRRLRLFLLIISIAISIEAIFRWSNGLEITWAWLGYRTGVLGAIMLGSGWFARHEARRERATGKPASDFLTSIFAMLFGGAGAVVWAWRTVDAFVTGRVIVSLAPDTYTTWSANPWGFAVAMGLGFFGVLLFLCFFVLGVALQWDSFSRRRQQPDLDESSPFRS